MDFSGVIWRKTDRASSGRPRSRSVSPPRSRPHTGEWGFDNAADPPYLYAYTAGGEQQISKSVGPRGQTQISPDDLKRRSMSTSPSVSTSTSTSVLTSTLTSTSSSALRNRNKHGSSSSLASVYDGFYLEGIEQESPPKPVAFNSNTVSEDKETNNFYSDDDDDNEQHDQNNDQNDQDHKQTTRLQTRPSSNLSANSKTSDAEPYKVISPEEVMLRGVDFADFQDDEGVILDGAGQPLPAYTASDNNNNSKGKRNSIWNRLRGTNVKDNKSGKDNIDSDELDDDDHNNNDNKHNNNTTNNNNNNLNTNNTNNNNNNSNNTNNNNNNNNDNNDDNNTNNDDADNDGATSRQRRGLSTSSDVVVKIYTTAAVDSNEPASHFYPETNTPARKPTEASDTGNKHFYPSPSSNSNEVVVDSNYAYSSPEDARAQTATRQQDPHITYDTPQLDNISSLRHCTPPQTARSPSPTNSLDSSTYGFGKGSNATSENGRNSKEFSPYTLSDGEDETNDSIHQRLESKPNPQSSSNTFDGANVERENDYNEKMLLRPNADYVSSSKTKGLHIRPQLSDENDGTSKSPYDVPFVFEQEEATGFDSEEEEEEEDDLSSITNKKRSQHQRSSPPTAVLHRAASTLSTTSKQSVYHSIDYNAMKPSETTPLAGTTPLLPPRNSFIRQQSAPAPHTMHTDELQLNVPQDLIGAIPTNERGLLTLSRLYVHKRDAVLSGKQPCTREVVAMLAAYQLQIEFGPHLRQGVVDIRTVLPLGWAAAKNIEQDIWAMKLQMPLEPDACLQFRFVKLCRSLPTYGATSFAVGEKIRGKTKTASRLLVLKDDEMKVCEILSLEVVYEMSLSSLRRWRSFSGQLTMDFGANETDRTQVCFITKHGAAITEVIGRLLSEKAKLASEKGRLPQTNTPSSPQAFRSQSGQFARQSQITQSQHVTKKNSFSAVEGTRSSSVSAHSPFGSPVFGRSRSVAPSFGNSMVESDRVGDFSQSMQTLPRNRVVNNNNSNNNNTTTNNNNNTTNKTSVNMKPSKTWANARKAPEKVVPAQASFKLLFGHMSLLRDRASAREDAFNGRRTPGVSSTISISPTKPEADSVDYKQHKQQVKQGADEDEDDDEDDDDELELEPDERSAAAGHYASLSPSSSTTSPPPTWNWDFSDVHVEIKKSRKLAQKAGEFLASAEGVVIKPSVAWQKSTRSSSASNVARHCNTIREASLALAEMMETLCEGVQHIVDYTSVGSWVSTIGQHISSMAQKANLCAALKLDDNEKEMILKFGRRMCGRVKAFLKSLYQLLRKPTDASSFTVQCTALGRDIDRLLEIISGNSSISPTRKSPKSQSRQTNFHHTAAGIYEHTVLESRSGFVTDSKKYNNDNNNNDDNNDDNDDNDDDDDLESVLYERVCAEDDSDEDGLS